MGCTESSILDFALSGGPVDGVYVSIRRLRQLILIIVLY